MTATMPLNKGRRLLVCVLLLACWPFVSCGSPPCGGRCDPATEFCALQLVMDYPGAPYKEVGYACRPYPKGCQEHTCACVQKDPWGGTFVDCSCSGDDCTVEHRVSPGAP
jgi:hypothetical protein